MINEEYVMENPSTSYEKYEFIPVITSYQFFFLSAAKRHFSRGWRNLGLTLKPTKKAALLMHYAF